MKNSDNWKYWMMPRGELTYYTTGVVNMSIYYDFYSQSPSLNNTVNLAII